VRREGFVFVFLRIKQKKKKRERKKKLKSYELECESTPVCALTKEGSVFCSFFQASGEREGERESLRIFFLLQIEEETRFAVRGYLYRGRRRRTEI
jgi:hypothetical protein